MSPVQLEEIEAIPKGPKLCLLEMLFGRHTDPPSTQPTR